MDIRQLSYFMAVAEHRSYSKASAALHVSQPTLSKMVKTIEEELGVVLFDRSTRRIQLTDAGDELRQHARSILQSFTQLHVSLADIAQSKRGAIKLGLPPVIGVSFFPKLIAQFRRQYPNIAITLVEEGSKTIERLIGEGKLDLGAVVLPVDERQFDILPLVRRELKLIVNRRHPLAFRREVKLRELRDEKFILFRQGFALYDRIWEACTREGFEPIVGCESAQWDFMSEMVAADQGVALLPETVCGKLDPELIAVVPTLEPTVHWNLALVWRKDSYLSYAARAWIDCANRYFQEVRGED